MSALSDIQRLVECESPTEDLAACDQVIDTAIDIASKVLTVRAEKIIENGRPVFGGELRIQKFFYSVI